MLEDFQVVVWKVAEVFERVPRARGAPGWARTLQGNVAAAATPPAPRASPETSLETSRSSLQGT